MSEQQPAGPSARPIGEPRLSGAARPVRALFETHDWSSSPLGPPDCWPQSLKTTVGLMLPAMAQIVLFWGPDYVALYNDAYAPTIGDKHPGAFGRPARESWTELWDDLEPLLASVRETGETVHARDRPFHINRFGYDERVWFDISYSAVPDESARVGGVLCIVSETTERVLAEETMRESEARFRAVADSAPAPIWVTGKDGIEFANRALLDFSGLPAEALFSTGWTSIIHPDDLPEVMVRRAAAWAGHEIYDFEARVRRADGEWRWLSASLKPRFDGDGVHAGFVGMALDVTDAKRADAELRESEARFRAMADCAPAPVWVTSESGIEFANRAFAEVAGRPAEEVTGDSWMDMVHADDLADVLAMREDAWRKGEGYGYEARFRDAAGSWRWMRVNCRPRLDGDGRLTGYVGLAVDVTEAKRAEADLRELNQSLETRIASAIAEREQAEEALRQSQKMEAVGQLTGGIAHDFNNLLTIITGNVDAARRHIGEDGPARVQRALGNALVGAERAAVLTQRLLAFSRRQPLNPRPIDPNRLVTNMSELLHRTLGETIAVETVLAAGLWQVEVDPHQLENAILNLAVNARDAMPEGGKLTIETANTHIDRDYATQNPGALPGQYVAICVSDIGAGMNGDTLKRAFEPFFTTKDVGKGTGLGLSMVYGFVKQSGGHVKIYSEEGQGTTVRIYLPRLLSEEAAEEERVDVPVPEGTREETILVCEDDDDVRAYTVEVLRELGYRVLEAHDGASALRLLERQEGRVDLLFTDVVLPGGMTGALVAQEARRLRPGLRILFTTGYARNAIVHHGRLDPGVELLTKPFAYADLASRVRDMLDRA